MRTGNGSPNWVRLNGTRVIDEKGNYKGSRGTIVGIHEHKLLRDALVHQVHTLLTERQQMHDRNQKLLEAAHNRDTRFISAEVKPGETAEMRPYNDPGKHPDQTKLSDVKK
jgi:hypothetical protein